MAHVFISYSSKHRDLTQQFVELLERENYTVWWDYALESWESYEAQIREALTGRQWWSSSGARARRRLTGSIRKRASDAGKLVNALPKGEPYGNVRQPFDVNHVHHLRSRRAAPAAPVDPDGKRVVTGSSDNTARLWDAESGAENAVLQAHASAINAASFSPDGKRV